MTERARERVRRLVRAAAQLADPASELGREARRELPSTTRLSAEGVELALRECLETRPSDTELDKLVARACPAARANVALPANVFIAAHRAIALALAESEVVRVRPSRREPVFARLLAAAAPGLFELVPELTPEPGDSLWAYGGDAALEAMAGRAPPGVRLERGGPGYGVAVVDAAFAGAEVARALASDMVPFDQRGCLSPRLALFHGSHSQARVFAALLAAELERFAQEVPAGALDAVEIAEISRFRDAQRYAGSVTPAATGFIAVPESARFVPAPAGRNLVIVPCTTPELALDALTGSVTSVGTAVSPALHEALARALPRARVGALGRMQRPPFDGPADLRNSA